MTTPILLVPGFWLGAWAWDEVAAELRGRGDEVYAHTPRGVDPADPERLSVTLAEQAMGIVEAIPAGRRAVLVAHSGAGVTGYLATDLAPGRFERVVYVDTAPAHEGFAVNPGLDPALREWELPQWSEFAASGASLDGLDDAALARFRARAISEPATIAAAPLRLSDRTARLAIPSTVICCSFSADYARQQRDSADRTMFDELNPVDADYADLPTGHWPMFSRPKELAELIHTLAHP
ncbi:alpha/beta fold hydrolase [Nocardia sp. NPDC052566]|uniref:alpha/beta fold hydrolase n=1 Tax=Nocardia sp. NPDC052566 TaxID=3364330 RepID=UPI0037C4FAFB